MRDPAAVLCIDVAVLGTSGTPFAGIRSREANVRMECENGRKEKGGREETEEVGTIRPIRVREKLKV